MHRHAFRAMGTDVELVLDAEIPAAVALRALHGAERELRRLESLLSRFDPGSELSRLNDEGTIEPGPELLDVVDAALEARERTGGRFDPTVLEALLACGYDRSFELLAADDAEAGEKGKHVKRCAGAVAVDHGQPRITLEPGVRLDLGGIAKGWAADRILPSIATHGPALANVGGDIAASPGSWPVGIDTPQGRLVVAISGGGLATSGRDRRRWRRGGNEHHHLIDPLTGACAAGDLITVTAVGASATEAEVRATALFLAGSADEAAAEADALSIPCVLVTDDERMVLAGGIR